MRYIILEKNSSEYEFYKDQIYNLRHKVFKEKLNWKVDSIEGNKEIDHFDTLPAVFYSIVVNDDDKVVGCMRFLPTLNDYMLEQVFPEILVHHPKNSNIWEISRFAIDPIFQKDTNMLSLNIPTLLILKGMCDFAKKYHIDHFIAATTATLNRLVRTIGMDTEVIGNKIQIEQTSVIALKIMMNEKTFYAVNNKLKTPLTPEELLTKIIE